MNQNKIKINISFYALDISKNTQTLILTIFSGAIATYEDS
jgi:hypothetical protein